jgi:hypothetical protein
LNYNESKTIMRAILILACVLWSSAAFPADNCVTNLRGKVICSNGEKAVAVNPNTGTATSVQKNGEGATTAQSSNGNKAAYNPKTGNAAVTQESGNGVATTHTTRGGEAKTKSGKGAVQGPNGTTCAKTAHNQGCKKG